MQSLTEQPCGWLRFTSRRMVSSCLCLFSIDDKYTGNSIKVQGPTMALCFTSLFEVYSDVRKKVRGRWVVLTISFKNESGSVYTQRNHIKIF